MEEGGERPAPRGPREAGRVLFHGWNRGLEAELGRGLQSLEQVFGQGIGEHALESTAGLGGEVGGEPPFEHLVFERGDRQHVMELLASLSRRGEGDEQLVELAAIGGLGAVAHRIDPPGLP